MLIPRLAFFVWVLVSLISSAVGEDWYRWRGANGNGRVEDAAWNQDWNKEQPTVAWTCSVGTGFSSVVVKDGRAYTIGHVGTEDVVHCLDVSSGEVIWKFGYPAELDDRDFEGGPTSTPTIDGDRLYVLGRAGELFCFAAASGELQWQKQIVEETDVRLPGWGLSAAPFVIGDTLLLNVGEAGAAVNKHSGELLWSSADRECGYATPVLIQDASASGDGASKAILASGRSYLCVDVASGEQLWSVRWLTSFNCNAADPILHDGKMFLCSGYNRGAALFELGDGQDQPSVIWKSKEMKNQIHGSILYQDHLYGIDGDMETDARLRCLDWATGDVIWSVDDLHPGGLAIVGDKLLLLTESGELILAAASPAGWAPSASLKVLSEKTWTAPVFCGGRVYCRSIAGTLVCVDCRD